MNTRRVHKQPPNSHFYMGYRYLASRNRVKCKYKLPALHGNAGLVAPHKTLLFNLPAPSKLKDLPLWLWQLPKISFDAFQIATSTRSTVSTIQGVVPLRYPNQRKSAANQVFGGFFTSGLEKQVFQQMLLNSDAWTSNIPSISPEFLFCEFFNLVELRK